ncbi:NAD-dependent epimerase/dehydratase family protein [Salinibacter altiplanensis]|uniref:NAD-dependent epimerase/dehydratase family protein n=1 Tax=Salinibacter altiplanensis TaxID=1803181 RepID=UPI00131A6023|nr:NAD-dependent epimerase/dehydratase family protein [Salinibacter altiplanensis]
MTVFVTGATGPIGRAVADALYRVGYTVLALAGRDDSAERLAERGYTVHRADRANPDALVEGARRADAVIHCPDRSANRPGRDRAAVDAMLEALRGTEAPFIYTSSLWVLGDTGGRVADETAPVDPPAFMAHVPAVEERVLNASGVRGVVLRPAHVYGHGGGLPGQMVEAAFERGAARCVPPGDQRWPFVHIGDLADLYVRALDAPAGTLLHASAGEAVTARAMAKAVHRTASQEGAAVPWDLDEARDELGQIADALTLDQRMSSDRARDLLGWRPERPPVLEALRDGIYAERASAEDHAYICTTCGTQHAPSDGPPARCRICEDERQYVGRRGQEWTTLGRLQDQHRTVVRNLEPGLLGIGIEPSVGLGQRALLVQTPEGNVLWDCIPLLDERAEAAVHDAGGIDAIAISHPHYYSSMVEWSRAFDAPIVLPSAAEPWVMRPDPAITYWEGAPPALPGGLQLVQTGGHFASSTVLHWPEGSAGRGALLTGDSILVAQDRRYVSFMRSFPNRVPLPADTVRRIGEQVGSLAFDRIYGAWFDHVVRGGAKAAVRRSVKRYNESLSDPPSPQTGRMSERKT